MKRGTRVRMRDVGGQWIKGTVQGPGETTKIRPITGPDEDIPTVAVKWDDAFRGVTDAVPRHLEEISE